MWFFRAVALDLDGTLSVGDRVSPDVLAALDVARTRHALLLVTGRVGADLDRVFPGLAEHFDAVVTENGAVLRTSKETHTLHDPVDPAVERALADRGVPTQRGEVLLAIDGRHGAAATQVIAELGLDYQVVRNRGTAMVLPAAVTKGTGLIAALDSMGLSAHNTIAVGDAENDLSLLRVAEVGAAVADAVPSLAGLADLVLDRENGDGVVGLLNGPLLRGHQRLCPPRHWVPIGWFEDGSPAMLPGSQSTVLVTGDTGSGKSYLAGLLAERWVDAGYSIFVVDAEGDHVGLAERPGVHLVDAAAHPATPNQLLERLLPGHASVVLDLSGLVEAHSWPISHVCRRLWQRCVPATASRTGSSSKRHTSRPGWTTAQRCEALRSWVSAWSPGSPGCFLRTSEAPSTSHSPSRPPQMPAPARSVALWRPPTGYARSESETGPAPTYATGTSTPSCRCQPTGASTSVAGTPPSPWSPQPRSRSSLAESAIVTWIHWTIT